MTKANESLLHSEVIESQTPQQKVNDKISEIFERFTKNYELSHKTLEELASFQSQKEISALRAEISNSPNISENEKNIFAESISDSELLNFFLEIQSVKNDTLDEKKLLLCEVQENTELNILSENKILLRKWGVSDKMMEAAFDPQNPYEHTLGATLGCAASAGNIALATFNVAKGIITTPRDIILIAQGKAQYTPNGNV